MPPLGEGMRKVYSSLHPVRFPVRHPHEVDHDNLPPDPQGLPTTENTSAADVGQQPAR